MALHWVKEDTPRWDADKQRLFGPEELAAVGYEPPSPGSVIADEWWRVTDDEGAVVGYGWLDSAWGDAEITFVVDRSRPAPVSAASSWTGSRRRPRSAA